jgi:hypothetical protein
MSDLINRQGTIDRINEYIEEYSEIDSDGNHSEKWCAMQEAKMTIKNMPSAQPEAKTNANGDWVILNKDKILKAGMEGREVDFRIGGRLFAIREKAQ